MEDSIRIGLVAESRHKTVNQWFDKGLLVEGVACDAKLVSLPINGWMTAGWQGRIGIQCREYDLDSLVVCGQSSQSSSLPPFIDVDGWRCVPVVHAAVDHCVGTGLPPEQLLAKARRIVEVALARALRTWVPRLEERQLCRRVGIVGGNHAAYSAAATLVDSGFEVVLFKTPASSGCFFPIAASVSRQILDDENVTVVEHEKPFHLGGSLGSFVLRTSGDNGPRQYELGALIIAVDASCEPLKEVAGLASLEGILTLREFGEQIENGGAQADVVCIWLDGDEPARQCASLAALRFALNHALQGRRSVILHRHVPVYGWLGQELYDRARKAGVSFVRYHTQSPQVDRVDGRIQVTVPDAVLSERNVVLTADRLVVPAPVRPSASFQGLSHLLNQPLDQSGFLQAGNVNFLPVGSSRTGVYFIGGCHDDCSPEQVLQESQAVLSDLAARLPDSRVRLPAPRVRLDPDKCAMCLTCYRECPHGAIQPDAAGERMEVSLTACQGCGLCVSVCPSAAIEIEEFPKLQISDTLRSASRPLEGPPVIAFTCRNSGALAADRAGSEGLSIPPDVILVEVPCAGQVSDEAVFQALESGARGVLVLGCHHGNCRSLWGSDLARARTEHLGNRLDQIGVPKHRVQFHPLASNETHRLVQLMEKALEDIPEGPAVPGICPKEQGNV